MKYYIGNFSYKEKGYVRKEYYISDNDGNIVAGDFNSYQAAKTYIVKVLAKRQTVKD